MPFLPTITPDELRARVDADPATVTDAQLAEAVAAAAVIVGNELDPDGDYTAEPNVAEAVAQIAVKVWDLRARGVQTLDMDGQTGTPALPATAGLVRSVRGLLLPSMPAGGITV